MNSWLDTNSNYISLLLLDGVKGGVFLDRMAVRLVPSDAYNSLPLLAYFLSVIDPSLSIWDPFSSKYC